MLKTSWVNLNAVPYWKFPFTSTMSVLRLFQTFRSIIPVQNTSTLGFILCRNVFKTNIFCYWRYILTIWWLIYQQNHLHMLFWRGTESCWELADFCPWFVCLFSQFLVWFILFEVYSFWMLGSKGFWLRFYLCLMCSVCELEGPKSCYFYLTCFCTYLKHLQLLPENHTNIMLVNVTSHYTWYNV